MPKHRLPGRKGMPTLSIVSRLRTFAGRSLQRLYYGSVAPPDSAFRRAVKWGDEGSAVAREVLAADKPCLIARLGSSELACVSFFTRWRSGKLMPIPYPEPLRRVMRINAGVFPVDDESLDRFCEIFLEAVSATDVMGVWFNRNEHRIIERFCPGAQLVQLESLNSAIRNDPWSAELAGKTVLVIHPFARTIESQYRSRRTVLFANPDVLPEFRQLITVPAVQSSAGSDCEFASWFDALEHMREEIRALEFDVAIVGAGAYGLPLAVSVKAMGRQAVHLGGATQLLFGIIGRRWEVESPEDVALLVNEHWMRPSAEETPSGAQAVEGGCYW